MKLVHQLRNLTLLWIVIPFLEHLQEIFSMSPRPWKSTWNYPFNPLLFSPPKILMIQQMQTRRLWSTDRQQRGEKWLNITFEGAGQNYLGDLYTITQIQEQLKFFSIYWALQLKETCWYSWAGFEDKFETDEERDGKKKLESSTNFGTFCTCSCCCQIFWMLFVDIFVLKGTHNEQIVFWLHNLLGLGFWGWSAARRINTGNPYIKHCKLITKKTFLSKGCWRA